MKIPPSFFAFVFFATQIFAADIPRALPEGKLPDDARLGELKDLDGYFPFTPPQSREAWEKRAEEVRRRILVANGLWPMPAKTPLNAQIFGKMDRGDYTVEKVIFESMPGFFVTGNLYRPKNASGKAPGVLSPHGHWPRGRFTVNTVAKTREDIALGAERFEDGGSAPLQARCVTLARLGCVVFQWDMIGYADSIQISKEIIHGFKTQRPEMNTTENWGLFSPQAEMHLQSAMGLQTWNSIRALDFLTSLPDVDAERIGCTGESGGGTQTIQLSAIDPRVKVSFPAVMVSTAMQGGCSCENASLLRIGTGNVEFAALFAPKPLGMNCADDWTREMSTKGFPELQRLYTLLGAPANVMLKRGEIFKHNFNYPSRAAMYAWMNKHLGLGKKEPIVEEDFHPLTPEEMTVWDDTHPKPAAGDAEFERKLLRWWNDDALRQMVSFDDFKKYAAPAWKTIINWMPKRDAQLANPREIETSGAGKKYRALIYSLRASDGSFDLPQITIDPEKWNGVTVVWLTENGKAGLFNHSGELRDDVCKLLDDGARVHGVDLFMQGEFLADGKSPAENRRVKNPREVPAYTFGYNDSLFAQRAQDVLTVIDMLQHGKAPARVALVSLDQTGPIAAAARAIAGEGVVAAAIRTDGFRFGKITDAWDANILPGAAKYGDVPGLLALAAPTKLCLLGETDAQFVAGAFKKSNAATNKSDTFFRTDSNGEAIDWLIEQTH